MRVLVLELLKKGEDGVRRLELSFQDIINTAHEAAVCGWALEGKEEHGEFILTHKSEIKFGKLLRKYAPLNQMCAGFGLAHWTSCKFTAPAGIRTVVI